MTIFEAQVVDKLVEQHKIPRADAARCVSHAKELISKDMIKGVDYVVSVIVEKGGLTPLKNEQVKLENSLNELTQTRDADVHKDIPDSDER